jgi:hypothetical protein
MMSLYNLNSSGPTCWALVFKKDINVSVVIKSKVRGRKFMMNVIEINHSIYEMQVQDSVKGILK